MKKTESRKTFRINLITMESKSFESMMEAARNSNIKVTTMKNRINNAIIDEKTAYFFSLEPISEQFAAELKHRFDNKKCGTRAYNRCVYAYNLKLELVKYYSNIAECAAENGIYHDIVSRNLTRNNSENNTLLPYNGIIYRAKLIDNNTEYKIVKEFRKSIYKKINHEKVEFDMNDVIIDSVRIDIASVRNYTSASVKVCYEIAETNESGAISGFKMVESTGEFVGILQGSNYRQNKLQIKDSKNIIEIPFFMVKSIEIVKFSQYLANTIRNLFSLSGNNDTANTLLSYADVLACKKYPTIPYFDIYNFINDKKLDSQKVLKSDFKGMSINKMNAVERLQKDLNNFSKMNNDAKRNI